MDIFGLCDSAEFAVLPPEILYDFYAGSVPGDRSCLFHALSFLMATKGRRPSVAGALRHWVADALSDSNGHVRLAYRGFMTEDEEGVGVDYTRYCEELRAGNVYGGPVELKLMADHGIKRRIVVLSKSGGRVCMSSFGGAAREGSSPYCLLLENFHYSPLMHYKEISRADPGERSGLVRCVQCLNLIRSQDDQQLSQVARCP